MIRRFILLLAIATSLMVNAADPTATNYSGAQCEGSAMPYPTPDIALLAYPDSLTPIFINHVGRHGARFLSSSKYTASLLRTLHRADSLRTITPAGKKLIKLCNNIIAKTGGRWGALDSLGMAEQRAIASRTFMLYGNLFDNKKIHAISSYVPRCIMSMDEFTHQLSRLNNKIEIYTSSGRQNSSIMRPWDEDREYQDYMKSEVWKEIYENRIDEVTPISVAKKIVGEKYPLTTEESRDIAINIYKVVSGCSAMSINADWSQYFSKEEYNALWSIQNLHHYLTHSASTLSSSAPELASNLLLNLISTTDEAVKGNNQYSVELRFGHAETLMPLFALMHLPGCYYMTNYFDTVGLHWRDFYVVPMAANMQMVLFKSNTGHYYVRVELNEIPVTLIPGRSTIYTSWEAAKEYLTRCLPLYMQP